MRGLTESEAYLLAEASRPFEHGSAEFYRSCDIRIADRLVARGLLRTVACGCCCATYDDITDLGRLALRLHLAVRAVA